MQLTLEKFRQTVSVFLISIIVGFASGSAVIASEVESDLEGRDEINDSSPEP